MNRFKMTLKSSLLAAGALALTLGFTGNPAGQKAEAASKVINTAPCSYGDHGLLTSLQLAHKGKDQEALHFTDIAFLNDSTGRAAGSGFLIGTSDGGCNWQEIYTGQWQFDQIVFPTNVQGWALARTSPESSVKLIHTTDGGSHWSVMHTAGAVFKKIDVLGTKTVIGYTSNGAYKSLNGGSDWAKIRTPINTRAAVFTDAAAQKGFALTVHPGYGYKLNKTINGGASWSLVSSIPAEEPYGGELYAKGKQAWALVYGGSGMSQVSYSLYGSHDSGAHWKRIIAQSTAGGGPAPGKGSYLVSKGPANPGGHPADMQLYGDDTAYLAAGSPAGGKVGVGRTYNGGRSWTNVPAVLDGFDTRISFPSMKTGWLAVTNSTNTAVYVTHDGGVSYNKKFSLPSNFTEVK